MKRFPLTLAAAALAVGLAGCATTVGNAPASPSSQPTSSAPAPSPSKVSVNVADVKDDPAARKTLAAAIAASAAQANRTGLVVVNDSATRPVTGVYDPARAVGESTAYYDAKTKTSQFTPVQAVKAAKAPLVLGDLLAILDMKGMKVSAPAGAGKWLIVLTDDTVIVISSKDGLIGSTRLETVSASGADTATFTYALDAAAAAILDTAKPAAQ